VSSPSPPPFAAPPPAPEKGMRELLKGKGNRKEGKRGKRAERGNRRRYGRAEERRREKKERDKEGWSSSTVERLQRTS